MLSLPDIGHESGQHRRRPAPLTSPAATAGRAAPPSISRHNKRPAHVPQATVPPAPSITRWGHDALTAPRSASNPISESLFVVCGMGSPKGVDARLRGLWRTPSSTADGRRISLLERRQRPYDSTHPIAYACSAEAAVTVLVFLASRTAVFVAPNLAQLADAGIALRARAPLPPTRRQRRIRQRHLVAPLLGSTLWASHIGRFALVGLRPGPISTLMSWAVTASRKYACSSFLEQR